MGCIVSDMLWGTKMPLPRSDDRSKGQSSTAESIGSYIDAKLAVYKAASRKAARRRDYGAELKRLNCEPLVYQKNVWRTPTVEECAAYEDAAFAALSTSHYTYAANPSAVQPLCGRPAALKLPPREFNLAMGDDRSRSELLKQLNAAHELPDGRRFRAEEAQLRACAAEAENKLARQKLRHVAGDKRELSRQLRDAEDGTEQLKHVSSLLQDKEEEVVQFRAETARLSQYGRLESAQQRDHWKACYDDEATKRADEAAKRTKAQSAWRECWRRAASKRQEA